MILEQTSLEAYSSILPHLNEMQKEIFEVFQHSDHALCDRELSSALGITINRITPRRGELEHMHMIKKVGQCEMPSGRHSNVYLSTEQLL